MEHQKEPAVRKGPAGISKQLYFFTIAIVAVVGFVAGTRGNELLAAVGPALGLKVETGTLDLSLVQKTYQELKANYDGKVDENALQNGAAQGLVEALDDPYTVFMDNEAYKKFDQELKGEIGGGIGAEIGLRNNRPTILRVLGGNPADQAGVKAGDTIAAVNDQRAVEWDAEKTATEIRGEVGTTVKLGVVRNGEEKEFTITRQKVNNPSVQAKVEDGIGILTLSRFDDETPAQVRQAARDFKAQNVKGVILDLRGNGGGSLPATQGVAGIWLNDKVVVSERVNDKVVEELKSKGESILAGMPTVVLVNGGSASASEIVAAALQDHRAATLLGEKTFGKGTVQKVISLFGGAHLKVTIARWFTPNGKNITKEGIVPDQVVELTADDANAGRDPQLDAARAKLGK